MLADGDGNNPPGAFDIYHSFTSGSFGKERKRFKYILRTELPAVYFCIVNIFQPLYIRTAYAVYVSVYFMHSQSPFLVKKP